MTGDFGEAKPALGEEVKRILASEAFRSAPVCRSLLDFLFQQTVAGERVSMHTLAEHLYKDPMEAETARRAVVEVRRRLDAYYAHDGRTARWRVVVPAKEYKTVLVRAGDDGRSSAAVPVGSGRTQGNGPATRPLGLSRVSGRAIVFAGVLAGLGVVLPFLLRPVEPAASSPRDLRFTTKGFDALGENGQLVYSHVTGEEMQTPNPSDRLKLFTIDDLDGKGGDELAVLPVNANRGCPDPLMVFDGERDVLRWTFEIAGAHGVRSELDGGPWCGTMVRSLKTAGGHPGEARLLLVVRHIQTSACRAMSLDGEGRPLGEFRHWGHLQEMTRWDRVKDCRDDIVLAGSNDEHHDAAIVLLDPERFGGCSPQDSAEDQGCGNFEAGGFLAYIRIPPPPGLEASLRYYVSKVQSLGGRLQVTTSTTIEVGGKSMPLSLTYTFEPDLRVRVRSTNEFRDIVAALVRQGLLEDQPDEAYLESRARDVLIQEGKAGAWRHAEPASRIRGSSSEGARRGTMRLP